MADEQQTPKEPQDGKPDSGGSQTGQDIETRDELVAALKEARSEAAGRRVENRKLRDEMDTLRQQFEDLTNQQAAAQDKRKAEDEGWQRLAEDLREEMKQLKAQHKEALQKAELQVERVKVAAEYGLNVPLDDDSGELLADRLRGATVDELREDAEKLARFLKPTAETPAQPEEDPSPEPVEEGAQPEQVKTVITGKTPSTTTAVPGGQPVGRTDADRQAEYFRNWKRSPVFQPPSSGGVKWKGAPPEN
jgi:hypothetical protein